MGILSTLADLLTGSGRREEGRIDYGGGLYRLTDTHDRRDRIANIRSVVTDAVSFGFWSKELYEEYIAAHPMPARRRPDNGRDVLSDFELAYWVKTGCPAPADLI